jgi:hypothetical protein
MLDQSTLPNNPKFIEMLNIIHLDEMWFYLTKNKTFTADEDDPHKCLQNKNSIVKVMLLSVVARPSSMKKEIALSLVRWVCGILLEMYILYECFD